MLLQSCIYPRSSKFLSVVTPHSVPSLPFSTCMSLLPSMEHQNLCCNKSVSRKNPYKEPIRSYYSIKWLRCLDSMVVEQAENRNGEGEDTQSIFCTRVRGHGGRGEGRLRTSPICNRKSYTGRALPHNNIAGKPSRW